MRVVDLFSGCGGLSLGFTKAGMDIVAAYDNWAATSSVYAANFNHPINNDIGNHIDNSTSGSTTNIFNYK